MGIFLKGFSKIITAIMASIGIKMETIMMDTGETKLKMELENLKLPVVSNMRVSLNKDISMEMDATSGLAMTIMKGNFIRINVKALACIIGLMGALIAENGKTRE